jgi:hypothetical protein
MIEPFHILSLGAGVQSSTLALMAAAGEITPMPSAAIFADTGAEPKPVMAWLDHLERLLPFPVHRVMYRDGLLASLQRQSNSGTPPFWTIGKDGRAALLGRQCTRDFKVLPVAKKVRELVGLKKGERSKGVIRAVLWIGISWDEQQRMRDSRQPFFAHRFPLVELKMRRGACLEWMERNKFPRPPKSACTFCPYHDNKLWREMKDNDPASWDQAVSVDELIRSNFRKNEGPQLFLHRSLKPLTEVDLSTEKERGQLTFDDECEGMCGV